MKTLQVFLLSGALVAAGLFWGCSSLSPKADEGPPPQSLQTQLEGLAVSDPERAVASLVNLFEEQREKGQSFAQTVLGPQGLSLYGTALAGIEQSFAEALSQSDITAALRLSVSASAIRRYSASYGELEAQVPAEFERLGSSAMKLQLIFQGAERDFAKSGYVAGKARLSMALLADPSLASVKLDAEFQTYALNMHLEIQDPARFYELWASRAEKSGDAVAQTWFAGLARGENSGANPNSRPSESWLADAVSSVATVYIDRGFRIQSGYSVPDRVLGTAFQIAKGLYLTNYHVIQSEVDPTYKGYSRMSIRPSENPQIKVPAKVIGWDTEMDLALIQSEEIAKDSILLPPNIKFQAGDRIFAVGSPVGLENSVTAGVVSSLNRKIITYGEAAQIDVPVNQGNSGSPLFSSDGTLVGMVFAGLPAFQNINFALPVQWLVASLPGLFAGKESVHARLGLMLGKGSGQNPLVLADLDPNLTAFRAGDILNAVDGVPSKDIASIQLQLAAEPAGALCLVEAQRNFETVRRLRPLQISEGASLIRAWDTVQGNSILEGLMGARLVQLEQTSRVGGLYTLQWTCPAEAADEIGLGEGDSIKVSRFQIDRKAKTITLEFSAKSRSSGYFERTIHLEFSTDSATII